MQGHFTLPSHTCVRREPKNLRQSDRRIFETSLVAEISAASVERLSSVEAVGRGPLRRAGQYLEESFVHPSHVEMWRGKKGHWRAAAERMVQTVTTIESPTVWITDNWSCGYYHWMCDALPRLELTSRASDLAELTLLLPAKCRTQPYIVESLVPYGLRKVRFLKRFERVVCHDLILPSHTAITGNYNHSIIRQMHERFVNHLSTTRTRFAAASDYGDRVYISRSAAGRRRIENEAVILPVLRKHGFSVLTAEHHPWEFQIRVAAGAKYLVSNHGAGLTNMLLMQPRGRVLEIRDAVEETPNCYFTLASAAELDYYYLLADRANLSQSVHHGNMLVDPTALDKALANMLA
jgi:capsular polysaccharide biosynthesis protein